MLPGGVEAHYSEVLRFTQLKHDKCVSEVIAGLGFPSGTNASGDGILLLPP